jgi:hypothetical protein
MKTYLVSSLLLSSIAFGDQGYDVYKNNCIMCHAELLTKKEAMSNLNNLKAPPMNEVSNRLKENIIIADKNEEVKKRVVIAFIKDYIQEPLIGDTMCHMGAVEKFGVMPAITHLKADELQAVAEWIYERYEDVKF